MGTRGLPLLRTGHLLREGTIIFPRVKFIFGIAAALVLAACGGAEKRKVAVRQTPKAPQVLPLRSIRPILQSVDVPKPDAVDKLIEQAEDLYSAGLDEYRAGNLDKAKEKFDQALSVILESKFNVDEQNRLRAEFDKLVEDIHSVELTSLERGDALALHHYVPAPIESFAGLTFPVDPNVKQQVQQEVKTVRSDLPLVSNDLVAGVINYFQSQQRGQQFVRKILERSGIYQPVITEALRKEGMPQDLIYLAGAESAFNPFALSRAGAKGVWQFMLGTGLLYGLKKDRWVDEREDPVKSTSAAVRHLKNLYQMFGDWYLAMAAYDTGAINVQRAIEKTGYADFWMLRKLHALPRETENYVPIILAAALIAKDPKAYGFDLSPAPPLATDRVAIGAPTDLRLVAQLIDHPVEELIQLNPSLLRWTTPANNPQFVLNLPPGTRETYEKAIASIPEDKRIWWRAHKVEEGETLPSLARKYRISRVALAESNHLDTNSPILAGARLVIPMAPKSEATLARVRERGPRRAFRYRIRPGDTLELIADRFDVTPYQIRRWNNLKTSRLVAGKTLRLYAASNVGYSPRGAHRRASRRPVQAGKKASPPEPSPSKTGATAGTPGPVAAR